MNAKSKKTLPGFVLFNQFFADLGRSFVPVACSAVECGRYLNALFHLPGSPEQEFRQLREDFRLTAVVREVRDYPSERRFVRFEFRRMQSDCTWSLPIQLMAVFNAEFQLLSYTTLRGRDVFEDGLVFEVTRRMYDWKGHETLTDAACVLAMLDSKAAAEVAIVDKATDVPLAYVYGGKGPRGSDFDVEWYLACEPWLFVARAIGLDDVKRLLSSLEQGGVRAFEEAFRWRQFEYEASWRSCGMLLNIDRELTRYLEFARRAGDEIAVREIEPVGIVGGPIKNPYCLRIVYDDPGSILSKIYDKSCEDGIAPTERSKLRTYLEIREKSSK